MDQHPDDSGQPPEEDAADERLPLIELETVLNRPPSLRKRLIEIGLALLAGAVMLAAFWGVFFPKQPAAPKAGVEPSQGPTTLVITSNVGYGTVAINGVPQHGSLPLVLDMSDPPPYSVKVTAPPFRPGLCTIGAKANYPLGAGGNCSEGSGYGYLNNGEKKPGIFLGVVFTAADLPLDLQSQVANLFPQVATFDQHVSIPAQSYVATSATPTGEVGIQRTAQALHGTATFAPSTLFNQPLYICQDFLCFDSSGQYFYPPGGKYWEIEVPVALNWRFTSATGEVVSDVSLPFAQLLTLFLVYSQAQGWQMLSMNGLTSINNQLAGVNCFTGATVMQLQAARQLNSEGWDASILVNHGVQGCLLELLQNRAGMGQFLWRFGVLLAADAQAHTLLPSLPIAPPDEIAAVSGA
jgi:hypothetical protein